MNRLIYFKAKSKSQHETTSDGKKYKQTAGKKKILARKGKRKHHR